MAKWPQSLGAVMDKHCAVHAHAKRAMSTTPVLGKRTRSFADILHAHSDDTHRRDASNCNCDENRSHGRDDSHAIMPAIRLATTTHGASCCTSPRPAMRTQTQQTHDANAAAVSDMTAERWTQRPWPAPNTSQPSPGVDKHGRCFTPTTSPSVSLNNQAPDNLHPDTTLTLP